MRAFLLMLLAISASMAALARFGRWPAWVALALPGRPSLALRLPPRAYTGLVLEGDRVTVTGIGR